jgi:Ca2+-transporting ATPase
LFAGKTGVDIIIQGTMQSILVLGSFIIGEYVLGVGVAGHKEAMTMAFITLSMIQLFHSYNMRSQTHSLFKTNPFENKFLNIAFLIGAVSVIVPLVIPVVADVLFDAAPLNAAEWGVALGFSVMIIPLVEIQKAIERAIDKKKAEKLGLVIK